MTVIIDVSATRTGNSKPGNNVVKVINSVVNGNASAVIVTRARGSNDILYLDTVKAGDSIQKLCNVSMPSF